MTSKKAQTGETTPARMRKRKASPTALASPRPRGARVSAAGGGSPAAAAVDAASERVRRRTVSMPEDVIVAAEARAGAREFSAYVTSAVRRQLERDRLDELLADMHFEGVIVDADVEADVDRRLAEAFRAAGL